MKQSRRTFPSIRMIACKVVLIGIYFSYDYTDQSGVVHYSSEMRLTDWELL